MSESPPSWQHIARRWQFGHVTRADNDGSAKGAFGHLTTGGGTRVNLVVWHRTAPGCARGRRDRWHLCNSPGPSRVDDDPVRRITEHRRHHRRPTDVGKLSCHDLNCRGPHGRSGTARRSHRADASPATAVRVRGVARRAHAGTCASDCYGAVCGLRRRRPRHPAGNGRRPTLVFGLRIKRHHHHHQARRHVEHRGNNLPTHRRHLLGWEDARRVGGGSGKKSTDIPANRTTACWIAGV